jgi:hypothetical protein
MKKWLRNLILYTGLILLIGSIILYGLQVYRNAPPLGSTPQQIDQFAESYGNDTAFANQYSLFLFLFFPGLVLLWIYGAIGVQAEDNPVWFLPKIIIILIILASIVTTLNSLAVASKAIIVSPAAFWMFLAVAALGLANFAFVMVIWNGFKWGMWAYGTSAFLMFVLKFAGSVPIVPSIIELSAVVVMIYLLRPIWAEME